MAINVREIVVSEFTRVFSIRNITVTQELLRIAEYPFNINAIQIFIDEEIKKLEYEYRYFSLSTRQNEIKKLENSHEERLRNLSRQYAIQLLRYRLANQFVTESIALSEQRSLKRDATISCDTYPCEK